MLGNGNEILKKIEHGGYFGELSLIKEMKVSNTVKAAGYCEIFMILRDKFSNLCEKTEAFKKIHAEIVEKGEKKLKREAKAKKLFGGDLMSVDANAKGWRRHML